MSNTGQNKKPKPNQINKLSKNISAKNKRWNWKVYLSEFFLVKKKNQSAPLNTFSWWFISMPWW
jgi:hypothetical protein